MVDNEPDEKKDDDFVHGEDLDFDEDFDEDWDLEEELDEEKEKAASTPAPKPEATANPPAPAAPTEAPVPVQAKEPTAPTPPSPPLEEPLISIQKIPMALVVELGQLEMSMEKLLAIEPGNILDLDFRPEEGVNLVINGKRVGKGEIIQIGETLGVRIIELGQN